MYEPEDLTADIPASPMTGQRTSSNSYYVCTYQHFINLVSKALRTACAIEQFTGQTTKTWWENLNSAVIPYSAFDFDTNRDTLHADELLFDMTENLVFGSVAEEFLGIL